MRPTVLIVEDFKATRERIEAAILEGNRFSLVGSADNYATGLKLLEETSPDILLTDLDLPDGSGLELIKRLNDPFITTKLAIVITIFGDEEHVISALKAGASGYLLKDDNFIDINNAIVQMLDGGSPISPSIARYLLAELTSKKDDKPELLSDREHEILVLVSKGYTTKEISDALSISLQTINSQVKNIYSKLSVSNTTEAIFEAKKQGII
jgi:DNA-binding NarL/FixJ family response regulator